LSAEKGNLEIKFQKLKEEKENAERTNAALRKEVADKQLVISVLTQQLNALVLLQSGEIIPGEIPLGPLWIASNQVSSATTITIGTTKAIKAALQQLKEERNFPNLGEVMIAIFRSSFSTIERLKTIAAELHGKVFNPEIKETLIVSRYRSMIHYPSIWARSMALGASQDLIDRIRYLVPKGWIPGHDAITAEKV